MERIRVDIALVEAGDECSCAILKTDGITAFLGRGCNGKADNRRAILCGHLQIACHDKGQRTVCCVICLYLSFVCSAGLE